MTFWEIYLAALLGTLTAILLMLVLRMLIVRWMRSLSKRIAAREMEANNTSTVKGDTRNTFEESSIYV